MTRIPPAELPDDLPVRNNLVRTAFHNPDMFRGFASLAGRVHTASHLPDRTRELVVLLIVGRLGADYERRQHEPIARTRGVADDEIEALANGYLSGFDGAERAALDFALAVEARSVDDALWTRVRPHLGDAELVDIAMLAGFYGLASRFALAFDIDPEPEPEPEPEPAPEPEVT